MIPMSRWCNGICAAACWGSCYSACMACALDPVPFDEIAGTLIAPLIGAAGAGIAYSLAQVL